MTPRSDKKCDNPICAKRNLLIADVAPEVKCAHCGKHCRSWAIAAQHICAECCDDVAQPEEQLACTEQVAGSTPAVGCAKCAELEARNEFLESLLDIVDRDLLRARKEIQRR